MDSPTAATRPGDDVTGDDEGGLAPDDATGGGGAGGLAPDSDTGSGGGPDRTTLAVAAVLAFVVIGVIGILIATGGDDGGGEGAATEEEGVPGRATAVFGTIDEFERPDDATSLGPFTADRPWEPIAGSWGIEAGDAYVSEVAEFRNHAVIGLGQPNGAVQVRVDRVTAGAGLVFRFKSPVNYWMVVASPQGATWNLIRVAETEQDFVGNTGPSPLQDGTTIAARFEGDTIEVLVNGQVKLTAEDDFLSDVGQVGMTVRGEDATEARFDDFVAALPGNRPLFVGDGAGGGEGGG